MIEDQTKFLDWLINRLLYKHAYDENDIIIHKLKEINSSYNCIKISNSELDQILIRYYPDFYMDPADDVGIGYTETQRNNVRNTIRSIVQDILGILNKEQKCYYN